MEKEYYEKIIQKFKIGDFYTKTEIMNGLTELGIIEKEGGLLNKISNELYFRRVYKKDGRRLKFMLEGRSKLYQMVTWNEP
jgi:hypothetical protein